MSAGAFNDKLRQRPRFWKKIILKTEEYKMNNNISKKQNNFFTRPISIFLTAILCTALWGSAIPVIKIGYEAFQISDTPSQMLFAGYRFFLAGIITIIFKSFISKRFIYPRKNEIAGIVSLGVIQTALQYILFYISLNYLTGVKGSIINSSGNFFAVILAHIFIKNDKLSLKKIIGCFLGFLGVIICNINGKGIDDAFSIQGEGLMILAAFSFASGSVITKFITKDENSNPAMITGYQLCLGGLILIIVGIFSKGTLSVPNFDINNLNTYYPLFILLYLSLLSSIAFSLWAELLKYNFVGKISIYGFLNPIFGVILSGILLNENIFNIETFGALFLVSLGILIVNINKSNNSYKVK